MGMYLRPGDKIANIDNIKSLQVDFQLPEKFLDKITPGMKVEVTSDAYPTKAFDGQIIALDPAINSINRTIKIRANLDNREELLRPGSFARVNVNYNVRESVTIPEMGLIKNQEGNTAFIIREATEDDMKKEKTRKASRDFFSKFFEEVMFKDMMIEKEPVFFIRKADIKIGNRSDDEVEIIEGIQEGEQVVTAGHQKIYQDKTVKIRGNK
jgi:membrane fusion protein (multidrug efflux system)